MIHPLGLILLLHGVLLFLSEAAAPGDFAAQIRQHFEQWDADRDACLSIHEIERALADPAVKGDEAAAAAALLWFGSFSIETDEPAPHEPRIETSNTATGSLTNAVGR